MAGHKRKQPARIQWPLTASQVESADEMFYELYKRVSELEAELTTAATATTTALAAAAGKVGPPGLNGLDGDDGAPGIGVPGLPGAAGLPGVGIPGADGDDGVALMFSATSTPQASEVTLTTTGNIDDLNLGPVSVLRMNNATLATIRGLQAGYPGQRVTIVSVGAGQVNLAHQNAGSVATNRLVNVVTGTNTSLAAGSGNAVYVYDGTLTRWRLDQHVQGDWIDVPYAAGDYTGGGGMTWTVDAADMKTFCYLLQGKSLTVVTYLDTTSVSGGAGQLFVAIPAGFVATRLFQGLTVGFDNGVGTPTYNRVGSVNFTQIEVGRGDATAWAAAVNNTYIRTHFTFPVT